MFCAIHTHIVNGVRKINILIIIKPIVWFWLCSLVILLRSIIMIIVNDVMRQSHDNIIRIIRFTMVAFVSNDSKQERKKFLWKSSQHTAHWLMKKKISNKKQKEKRAMKNMSTPEPKKKFTEFICYIETFDNPFEKKFFKRTRLPSHSGSIWWLWWKENKKNEFYYSHRNFIRLGNLSESWNLSGIRMMMICFIIETDDDMRLE